MNPILKFAIAAFAVALIAAGAVLTVSPIPGGIVIFAIGLILLAAVMPSAVRAMRRRCKLFDRLMHRIEKILPKWLARRLRASDYDHSPDDVEGEKAPDEKSRTDHR